MWLPHPHQEVLSRRGGFSVCFSVVRGVFLLQVPQVAFLHIVMVE